MRTRCASTTPSTRAAASAFELGGRPFYTCASAEKMSAPFHLRVHGRSGHASMPGIADNALVKAAPLIEALAAYRPEAEIGPGGGRLPRRRARRAAGAGQVLERLGAVDPLARELIEPLLSLTLSPTMIGASERRNVVPAVCDVTVDCRILPGQTPADVEPLVRDGAARVGGGRGRVRARVDRAAGAARAPRWTRRSGAGSRAGSARPRRARAWRRCCAPASPTRTGCATRSAPSRTASSR